MPYNFVKYCKLIYFFGVLYDNNISKQMKSTTEVNIIIVVEFYDEINLARLQLIFSFCM